MWMMMICCMLPLILLSLFGQSFASLPRWVMPAFIIAMLGFHYVIMHRKHGKSGRAGHKSSVDNTHDHTPPNT